MAIRTYGPLPVTILGASSEGGPNYFFDCDTVGSRPAANLSKDGDLAWTRDERKLYLNDTNVWVQLYPFSGAGGVGTSGRDSVTQTAFSHVVTHNQSSAAIAVTAIPNWPTTIYEDETQRTPNAVTFVFGTAAPAGAKLNWRAG